MLRRLPRLAFQTVRGGLPGRSRSRRRRARQMGPELWHYFSSSECEQRDPEVLGCLVSRLQIGMAAEVPYDLVAWTEAAR